MFDKMKNLFSQNNEPEPSKGRYVPVETTDAVKLLPRKHYCQK